MLAVFHSVAHRVFCKNIIINIALIYWKSISLFLELKGEYSEYVVITLITAKKKKKQTFIICFLLFRLHCSEHGCEIAMQNLPKNITTARKSSPVSIIKMVWGHKFNNILTMLSLKNVGMQLMCTRKTNPVFKI